MSEIDERLMEFHSMLYRRVIITTVVKVSPEFICDPHFGYSTDENNVSFVGYLKTVDPETEAAILVCIKDGLVLRSMLVLGHCIKSITLLADEKNDSASSQMIKDIIEKDDKVGASNYVTLSICQDESTREYLANLKEPIKNWLTKNKIPVRTQDGTDNLIIANCVILKPPFTDECNYICPNRIVLYRIKSIIDQFIEQSLADRKT